MLQGPRSTVIYVGQVETMRLFLRLWPVFLPIFLVTALASSEPLHAQTLEGQVFDGQSLEPLAEARLTLLHPDGRTLGNPVITGADGRFLIHVPGPGKYFLRAERLSYQPVVDGVLEFAAPHAHLAVEFFLLPRPLEIEGLEVTLAGQRRQLRVNGFYERAASGFGDFIGPEQIERRMAFDVSDYLRSVPGIRLVDGLVFFRSRRSRIRDRQGNPIHACEPNVWVDGILMAKATPPGAAMDREYQMDAGDHAFRLDDMVQAPNVVGIEVYRGPAATPARWGGLNGTCGTIVIWTDRGGR